MKLTREFYIPKGAAKVQAKDSSAVVYLFTLADVPYAKGFHGKAAKPDFYYRFKTPEARAKRVAEYFARWAEIEARSLANRAEHKAKGRGLEVGDILRRSWGYDQTNVDYWEITALIGRAMVEIRKIGAASVGTGWERGQCAPLPGNYIGEPERRIAKEGRVKINHYAWAWKVEPESNTAGVKVYGADSWTSYA